jgi:phenylalanine-4-hydroxylase
LKKTGIEVDNIPMYGMNRILTEIGWAAVAVDIPPNAFMEFQAL